MSDQEVRTSVADWRDAVAKALLRKENFTIFDDAGIGVDLSGKNLLDFMISAGLTKKEIIAIASGVGVAGIGTQVLRVALADPEPLSKIALGFLGGAMVLLPFGAVWKLLTGEAPGVVEIAKDKVSVRWA